MFTSAMLVALVRTGVENDVLRNSEFRIFFICDARVLDDDWQVFTRYGGQQGETK